MSQSHDELSDELNETPISHIPLNVEGAQDLEEETAAALAEAVEAARNTEELRQIADRIVEATGYGSSHVLSTSGFGHSFALSGLHRAAELAHQIEARGEQLGGWGVSPESPTYHGYREALYEGDADS